MSVLLDNLSIGYGSGRNKKVIQSEISAELKEGVFTSLLGPNGAGKSTLLRTITGFLLPLHGSVIIEGESLSLIRNSRLSRLVSVVLTERPSVSAMNVLQLVELGRSPYTGISGRLSDEDRRRAQQAIRLVGADHLCKARVDALSDGELQRVMVAKALAQDTKIIVLDEPTAFLDFPSKVELMQLLKRIAHEQNKIILQSTHDINMAINIADNLWLLDRKLGFCSGTPSQLADRDILAQYFVRPGISFDAKTLSFKF